MFLQGNVLKQSGDSKIVLCIDQVEAGDYIGRLYNQLDRRELPFHGFLELMHQVEGILARIKFPRPAHAYHSFLDTPETEERSRSFPSAGEQDLENLRPGSLVTFTVQVQFRQNATWFGLFFARENTRPQRFQSVLELVRFIDQAIPHSCE